MEHGRGLKPYLTGQENGIKPSPTPRPEQTRRPTPINSNKRPPPPPVRTSSVLSVGQNKRPAHKENVIIQQTGDKSNAKERVVRLQSGQDVPSPSPKPVERVPLNDTITPRIRSNSQHVSATNSGARDESHYSTLQTRHRSSNFLNPNSASQVPTRRIHSIFSASQPMLNVFDDQGVVKPKDRLKSTLFTEENENGIDDEYGSSYNPRLMKISHGDIQKHAVAVTVPLAPPVNPSNSLVQGRAGSDPNLLDTFSETRAMRSPNGDKTQSSVRTTESEKTSPARERSSSVTAPSSNGSNTLTSSIAKAYREHLIEKIEKEKRLKSASPSPSGSSVESPKLPDHTGESTSSKLKDIMSSELQGLDVPDREYYPRILPPSSDLSAAGSSKHSQAAITVHNGGHQIDAKTLHNRENASNTSNTSNSPTSLTQTNGQHKPGGQDGSQNRVLSYNDYVSYFNQSSAGYSGNGVPRNDLPTSPHPKPRPPNPYRNDLNSNASPSDLINTTQNGRNSRTTPLNGRDEIDMGAVGYSSNHLSMYGTLPRHHHQQWTNQAPRYRASSVSEVPSTTRKHGGSQYNHPMPSPREPSLFQKNQNRSVSVGSLDQLPMQEAQNMPAYLFYSPSRDSAYHTEDEIHYHNHWSNSSQSSSTNTSLSYPYQGSPDFRMRPKFNGMEYESDATSQGSTVTNESSSLSTGVHSAESVSPMMTKKQVPNPSMIRGKLTNKPPTLPKPRKKSLSAPNNHERVTSDPPSLDYRQVSSPRSGNRQNYPLSPALSSTSAPTPTPSTPHPRESFNTSSDQQTNRIPPMQYSRDHHSKNRHANTRQISTNLLKIHEADEASERVNRRMTMKFSDYVTLNSSMFPKRVQVTKGFCSNSTEVTLSRGEIFDLHFVREIKAAMLMDSNATQYAVPLNSVATMSVLYDPFDVERVALLGFHFKTAGAIMDLKNPPTVVAATRSFDGGNVESSVEENEILVLDGIKNVFHGRLLKAFSLKFNTMKYLDEKCSGNFNTHPAKIKMTLAEIYDSSIPLPQKILLHPGEIAPSIPASMQSNASILKQYTVKKYVVASPLMPSQVLSSLPVTIAADLDIDIQEVVRPDSQDSATRDVTRKLLESFDVRAVSPYVDMPSPSSHLAQCALLKNLDPKLEMYNAEVVTPSFITSPVSKKRASPPITSRPSVMNTSNPIAEMRLAMESKIEIRLKAVENKYEQIEMKVSKLADHLNEVSLKVDQIHTYLKNAQVAMTKHKKMLEQTKLISEEKDKPQKSERSSNSSLTSENSTPASSSLSDHSRPNSKTPAQSTKSHKGSRSSVTHSKSSTTEFGTLDDPSLKALDDDVFITKRITSEKPPVLPKPKSLLNIKPPVTRAKVTSTPKGQALGMGNSEQKIEKESSAVKNENEKKETSSVITDEVTEITSSHVRQSSHDSIDLKDYLLPTAPKSTSDNLDAVTDDLADWCLQIEDELTQLYNESILS